MEKNNTEVLMLAIGGLKSEVMQAIAELGTRIDGLSTRVDGLETRMGGLETRTDGLSTRMDGFEARLVRIETNMATKSDIADIKAELVVRMSAQNTEVDRRLKKLEAPSARTPRT